MGRCYEFGVSITDGCDHAMVVSDEGGKCVCVGCGTPCTGKFEGCQVITSQPGYVPALAPEWARTADQGPLLPGDVAAHGHPEVTDDLLVDLRAGVTPGPGSPSPLGNGLGRQRQSVVSPVAQIPAQAESPPPGITPDEFFNAINALRHELLMTRGAVERVGEKIPAMSREDFLDANQSLGHELHDANQSLRHELLDANQSLRQELLDANQSLRQDLHHLQQVLDAHAAPAKRPVQPASLSRQEFFQAHGLLRNEMLGTLAKVERAADNGSPVTREDVMEMTRALDERLASIQERLDKLEVGKEPVAPRPVAAVELSATSAWTRATPPIV